MLRGIKDRGYSGYGQVERSDSNAKLSKPAVRQYCFRQERFALSRHGSWSEPRKSISSISGSPHGHAADPKVHPLSRWVVWSLPRCALFKPFSVLAWPVACGRSVLYSIYSFQVQCAWWPRRYQHLRYQQQTHHPDLPRLPLASTKPSLLLT